MVSLIQLFYMKKSSIVVLFLLNAFLGFSQTVSNDTIHWSSSKPLTWNDFKGDVIDSATVIGEAFIEILASEKKGSRFAGSTTYVVTVFDWRNSWIKPKSETDTYLKYFQVMFDISEVYSRKLRKAIKEIDLDPYPVSFDEKYNASKIGLKDRIRQFKKESKLGTYDVAINRWADNLKTEMAELEAYKQSFPKATK